MPSQLLRGSAAEVTTNLSLAFNGTVPSNPIFASYTAEFTRVGEFALANAFAASFSNVSNAALTTQVLSNLGVTAATIGTASYAALATAVETAFASFPNARGQVGLNLARLLSGLEGDATYGNAATAWNNSAAASFTYSSNTANTSSTTIAAINAPVARSTTLTAGIDTFSGGVANDVISASTNSDLNSFDSVNGGAGIDTLVLSQNMTAANTAAVTDVQFTNVTSVETLRVTGVDVTADTSAGLQSVTLGAAASAAGIATISLEGSLKNLALAGFTNTVSVTGTTGADTVSLTAAQGAKTLNLGGGMDTVNITTGSSVAAGGIKTTLSSGDVGNGTANNVTLNLSTGNVVIDDEGVTISNAAGSTNAVFNVVGLDATGAEDATQNRGNFMHLVLGTSAADTIAPTLAGALYINAGSGNDTITVNTAGDHFVVGGAGNDSITISAAATGAVSVIAGSGDDTVTVNTTAAVNVNLTSGTNTITFASGTLTGDSVSTADTVTGGTGRDTLTAAAADLVAYTTPVIRTISGIEAVTANTAAAADATLTVATIQPGIDTVSLRAGTLGAFTIANETGSRTVTLGSTGANTGALGGALTVSAAGTATTDALTLTNSNANTSTVTNSTNAFNGQSVTATGYESVTVNSGSNGATGGVAQILGAVTVRGTPTTVQTATTSAVTTALSLTLSGANAVEISTLNAATNGLFTVDASGVTSSAGVKIANAVVTNLSRAADSATGIAAVAAGALAFTGSAGADSVIGGTGADNLSGGAGNDTLAGGAGADTISGGDGLDSITGGDGNDSLSGGAGNDTIAGDAGNDIIDGGDGADSITGGDGNDNITAGAGADTVGGGDGNDTIDGGDGADNITGGTGNDNLTGGAGNDVIAGEDGNDIISGGDGADNITGGLGSDNISGGAGNDTIDSGDGDDTVTGGAGADTIALGVGNGNDTVIIGSGDAGTAAGASGAAYAAAGVDVSALDIITGFGSGDTLSLPFAPTGVASTASGTNIALVYGFYDEAAKTFRTASSTVTGNATMVIYDTDGAGPGTDMVAVILVGNTLATGGTGGTINGG